MPRDTHAENQIPANGAEDVPYIDQRSLINGVLRHLTETFVFTGTGAGGAGFEITEVPFEPVVVIASNPGGGTPTVFLSVFGSTAQHAAIAAATAANGTPPVLTQVGEGDWTVEIPTGMAPNGEDVSVVLLGCPDKAGSE